MVRCLFWEKNGFVLYQKRLELGKFKINRAEDGLFIGGPPDKRSFIYAYHPTRASRVATYFIEDFRGYIHADCYSAYVGLGKKEGITHVACMAHARRYFVDVTRLTKKKKGLAFKVVEQIARLYHLEKTLKEEQAPPERIKQVRQEKAEPILLGIKTFIRDNITKQHVRYLSLFFPDKMVDK
jgi:transposase